MPDPLLFVIELVLVLTFGWAVVAKLVHWGSWTQSLVAYGFPERTRPAVALLVPVAELVVAILVLAGPIRVGLAATLLLVSAFSLGILRARSLQGDQLPCGCFGGTESRDYRLLLVRNAFLGALAGIALVGGASESVVSLAEVPSSSELLPALLVTAGVALVSWLAWQAISMKRREHP